MHDDNNPQCPFNHPDTFCDPRLSGLGCTCPTVEDRAAESGHLEKALELADLALRLGEVDRATAHQDGRPETDTTHTVMLALLVAELGEAAGVNTGRAIAFALVHDLVEAWIDDTCTAWGLDDEAREAKKKREQLAAARLSLMGLHKIHELVVRYERQEEPEARFVRYIDKICPKLTHLKSEGRALRAIGLTAQNMIDIHAAQGEELREQYPEQAFAGSLFELACSRCEAEIDLPESYEDSDTVWGAGRRYSVQIEHDAVQYGWRWQCGTCGTVVLFGRPHDESVLHWQGPGWPREPSCPHCPNAEGLESPLEHGEFIEGTIATPGFRPVRFRPFTAAQIENATKELIAHAEKPPKKQLDDLWEQDNNQPEPVSTRVLSDLIALVVEDAPGPHELEVLTQDERQAIANWAGRVHLRASDNDGAEVPQPPAEALAKIGYEVVGRCAIERMEFRSAGEPSRRRGATPSERREDTESKRLTKVKEKARQRIEELKRRGEPLPETVTIAIGSMLGAQARPFGAVEKLVKAMLGNPVAQGQIASEVAERVAESGVPRIQHQTTAQAQAGARRFYDDLLDAVGRARREARARQPEQPKLSVFTYATFPGKWPTGVAAVVVACDQEEAREQLAESMQISPRNIGAMREVDLTRPGAIVLQDGDY